MDNVCALAGAGIESAEHLLQCARVDRRERVRRRSRARRCKIAVDMYIGIGAYDYKQERQDERDRYGESPVYEWVSAYAVKGVPYMRQSAMR